MSTSFHANAHLTVENALPHIFRMIDYPQLLKSMMAVGKMKQQPLARLLQVSQPTVSRWLGGAKPELDQHRRIMAEAARLGLAPPSEPFEAEEPDEMPLVPTVKVVGYVGAGEATHFYAVAQGELDEIPAPSAATPETVAVEIKGSSLGELFDRWFVFYDDVRRPVSSDLIGRLCVVGLSDERVLVKKIRRGRNGLFDLYSNTEEPIRDVAIEWAARVKQMMPR